MFGPYKPKPGDPSISYDLIRKMYYDGKKNGNLRLDSRQFLTKEDATGRYVTLANTNQTTMFPWKLYVSPDASKNTDGSTNTAGWRTIRTHQGTINGFNANTVSNSHAYSLVVKASVEMPVVMSPQEVENIVSGEPALKVLRDCLVDDGGTYNDFATAAGCKFSDAVGCVSNDGGGGCMFNDGGGGVGGTKCSTLDSSGVTCSIDSGGGGGSTGGGGGGGGGGSGAGGGTGGSNNNGTYSDDSDVDSNNKPIAAHMDMVMDADKKYFVVLVQSVDVHYWSINQTYIFFIEDTDGNEPYPGYTSSDMQLFKNCYYTVIGTVDVGSDTTGDSTYHKLTINQLLNKNLENSDAPVFTAPVAWEPIVTVNNPVSPDSLEWKNFFVNTLGAIIPLTFASGWDDVKTANASPWIFYAKATLNSGGDVTTTELLAGSTSDIAPASTPAVGHPPAWAKSPLSIVYTYGNTSTVRKMTTQVIAKAAYYYQTVTIGYGVTTSNTVANILAGEFYG